jgi:hypothetical protein
MTINANDEMAAGKGEAGFVSVLRAAALIGLLVGAVGSVGLVLHAGHRKHSPRSLMVLFAIWVLSPFVALVVANIVSKDWSVITRATLHSVMLVLMLGSLAIYGDVALGPLGAKTVPVFVIVPPASWLLIATVVSIAALISRGLSHRS